MTWRFAICGAFVLALLSTGSSSLAQNPGDSSAEEPSATAVPEAAEPEDLPGPPVPVSPSPPPRAMLGVYATSVALPGGFQFPWIVPQGALITSLVPGSPADRAGLPLGGVLVAFDGQRIESPEDLARFVHAARPGQKVELQYVQANRLFRKSVQLAPSPPTTEGQPLPFLRPELQLRVDPNGTQPLREGRQRPTDPYAPQTGPPPPGSLPAAAESSADIAELRSQVEALQRQVLELRDKIAELEQRLAARTPE